MTKTDVKTKVSDNDFNDKIGKLVKCRKDWLRLLDELIPDCIDSYNVGLVNHGQGTKQRFAMLLNPNVLDAHEGRNVITYLRDTTNIKSVSLNVATNKLKLTVEDTEENDMKRIHNPSMSYQQWLKIKASQTKTVEVTEDTLLKALKGLRTRAEKAGFNFNTIVSKIA